MLYAHDACCKQEQNDRKSFLGPVQLRFPRRSHAKLGLGLVRLHFGGVLDALGRVHRRPLNALDAPKPPKTAPTPTFGWFGVDFRTGSEPFWYVFRSTAACAAQHDCRLSCCFFWVVGVVRHTVSKRTCDIAAGLGALLGASVAARGTARSSYSAIFLRQRFLVRLASIFV